MAQRHSIETHPTVKAKLAWVCRFWSKILEHWCSLEDFRWDHMVWGGGEGNHKTCTWDLYMDQVNFFVTQSKSSGSPSPFPAINSAQSLTLYKKPHPPPPSETKKLRESWPRRKLFSWALTIHNWHPVYTEVYLLRWNKYGYIWALDLDIAITQIFPCFAMISVPRAQKQGNTSGRFEWCRLWKRHVHTSPKIFFFVFCNAVCRIDLSFKLFYLSGQTTK